MLRERIQRRHQWIALLTTLALKHFVDLPRIAGPQEAGLATVPHADIWHKTLQTRLSKNLSQHGAAPYMVKGTNTIDRNEHEVR